MKVVFFGTPYFSAEILKDLIEKGVEICAVVTQPDKQQGRNLKVFPSPVKKVAQSLLPNTPIHQPIKVRDSEFQKLIATYNADFFVVVAFGQIFPKSLLDMPPKGCINVHTSLLPKLRGAAPIQRAIINGDTETGATIMYMAQACDAGDILSQKKVNIEEHMDANQLALSLCHASKQILLPTLKKVLSGEISPIKQIESEATFAPKIKPETAFIDWSLTNSETYNLYRGVHPRPGAWTYIYIRGKKVRLKLLAMKKAPESGAKGSILAYQDSQLIVACQSGSIQLTHVQLEGKKATSVAEFIRGYPKDSISFV